MATPSLRPTQPPPRTAVLASADLSFRQGVRDALTGLRWQVREASGGAEALAHLDVAPAEALIVDSWLPDLEVQEFITEFEKIHPSVDVITVEDQPARRNVARSPRRNEVLLALRKGQDESSAGNIAPRIDSGPVRPLPLTEAEVIHSDKNRAAAISPEATPLNKSCRLPEFIGEHPAMLKVSHRIRLVAPHSTPVLVEGPTGTGKELVARALHRLSPRSSKPSVNLNEEAASLESFEQSYESASKIFTVLDQVMTAALNLGVETTYAS